MHNAFKLLFLLSIACTQLVQAKPFDLPPNLILVSNGIENGYEDFYIYLDTKSIKSVTKSKKTFNLITYGLSIDDESNDPPLVDNEINNDFQNQDNIQMVILSELNCNNNFLRPISFVVNDAKKGEVFTKAPQPSIDINEYNIDTDDLTLNTIHGLVCK